MPHRFDHLFSRIFARRVDVFFRHFFHRVLESFREYSCNVSLCVYLLRNVIAGFGLCSVV